MPSGIIVINKPPDWTSHDVVAKLRGILRERRIGHAGTLDPMATGVLPVFVGRATRAVEFAAESEKEYVAGLRLGLVTNTQDTTGETLCKVPVSTTREELEAVLSNYRGDILQIPPMFSAIKQQGKKLYELARAGKEVVREPRPVSIYALELLEQVSETDYRLRILCSKGTYVRTLCHDIGAQLGVGGALYSLTRTKAAGFTLAESVSLDTLRAAPAPLDYLLPVDHYFSSHPPLCVPSSAVLKIRNGVSFSSIEAPGLYRVYDEAGNFLMLGRVEDGCMSTVKSFFEV